MVPLIPFFPKNEVVKVCLLVAFFLEKAQHIPFFIRALYIYIYNVKNIKLLFSKVFKIYILSMFV